MTATIGAAAPATCCRRRHAVLFSRDCRSDGNRNDNRLRAVVSLPACSSSGDRQARGPQSSRNTYAGPLARRNDGGFVGPARRPDFVPAARILRTAARPGRCQRRCPGHRDHRRHDPVRVDGRHAAGRRHRGATLPERDRSAGWHRAPAPRHCRRRLAGRSVLPGMSDAPSRTILALPRSRTRSRPSRCSSACTTTCRRWCPTAQRAMRSRRWSATQSSPRSAPDKGSAATPSIRPRVSPAAVNHCSCVGPSFRPRVRRSSGSGP